jgi:capsular polysaccharide export protein
VATARAERPGADLLVRPHPDVVAGYRRGHFGAAVEGARLVGDDVDTHAVLDVCDEVWTVSSQIGFEALMRGIPVTTFGMPFYAGWGLTDDRAEGAAAVAARQRRSATGVSVDTVARAALIDYPRYADPETARPLDVDAAIDHLVAARSRSADGGG